MNGVGGSSIYADPKFPPSEEYNQNSYIPTQSVSDYYVNPQHYGYPQVPYGPYSHQMGGYYSPQQSCTMGPQLGHVVSIPHQVSSPGVPRSNVGSPSPLSCTGAIPPGLHQQHMMCQSQLQSQAEQLQGHIALQQDIQNRHQQQQQLTEQGLMSHHSGRSSSPSSECSDDGNLSEGANPVIYPWMKKIHVAGAG